MANELDEAEATIRDHAGLDNDDIGRLLTKLFRHVRALTGRVRDLEQAAAAAAPTAAPDGSASPIVVDEVPPPS